MPPNDAPDWAKAFAVDAPPPAAQPAPDWAAAFAVDRAGPGGGVAQ
jgi:hypothetical protein